MTGTAHFYLYAVFWVESHMFFTLLAKRPESCDSDRGSGIPNLTPTSNGRKLFSRSRFPSNLFILLGTPGMPKWCYVNAMDYYLT